MEVEWLYSTERRRRQPWAMVSGEGMWRHPLVISAPLALPRSSRARGPCGESGRTAVFRFPLEGLAPASGSAVQMPTVDVVDPLLIPADRSVNQAHGRIELFE